MARSEVNLDMNKWVDGTALNLLHFDYVWPKAYPHFAKVPFATRIARKLTKDGVVKPDQLLEKAIGRKGGLVRAPGKGKDYTDISDSKFCTARIASKNTMYSARISNIHCKRGFLRALVHERTHNKFYHFLIPFEAYRNLIFNHKTDPSFINSNAAIEIPFNLDGTPKLENHWWKKYLVPSFDAMCLPLNNVSPNIYSTPCTKTDPTPQTSTPYSLTSVQQQILETEETQPTSLCEIS